MTICHQCQGHPINQIVSRHRRNHCNITCHLIQPHLVRIYRKGVGVAQAIHREGSIIQKSSDDQSGSFALARNKIPRRKLIGQVHLDRMFRVKLVAIITPSHALAVATLFVALASAVFASIKRRKKQTFRSCKFFQTVHEQHLRSFGAFVWSIIQPILIAVDS